MNFNDTIYYSCAAWSSIHPNRAAALNHLFCTNGNGYEWIDGELVECCGMTTYKSGKRMSLRAAINNVFRDRKKRNDFREQWERKRKREEKRNPQPVDKVLDAKLEELIDNAIKAEKKLRDKDPVAYEQLTADRKKQWQETKRKIREERRWDYAIPTDIKDRIQNTEFTRWYPMSPKYFMMWDFPEDIKPDWLEGIIETCDLIIQNPGVSSFPRQDTKKEAARNVEMATVVLLRATALQRKRRG